MEFKFLVILLSIFAIEIHQSYCVKDHIKLSFEVENNDEFCFYHKFNDSIEYLLEYGVIKGGNYDINFYLESPNQKRLYSATKVKRLDVVNFYSSDRGEFKFCFSNSFSKITHKIVYFELKPSDVRFRDTLKDEVDTAKVPGVVTASEYILNNIHFVMGNVSKIQEFYRHEEAIDKNFAEMLRDKITILSAINFFTILFVSFFQVKFLKRFFEKNRPITYNDNNSNYLKKTYRSEIKNSLLLNDK